MVQKVNFSNLRGDTLTVGNTVITGTGVTVGGEALGGGGGGVSATTLTKTFANSEVYTMTLDNAIEGAPIVGATRLGGGVGTITKDNWDVNSTASNYDLWNEAPPTDILKVYANNCPWQPHEMIDDNTPTSGTTASLNPSHTNPLRFQFNDDGTYFYLFSTSTYDLNYWKLPTPYEIASNTSVGGAFVDSNQLADFHFSANGSYIATIDQGTDDLYFYELSTPWDLTTATSTGSLDPAVGISYAGDRVLVSPDGKFVYFKDSTTIYKWELTTAWDPTSATNGGVKTEITNYWNDDRIFSNTTADADWFFNDDGSEIFLVYTTTTYRYGLQGLISYSMSTPGDLETLIESSHIASSIPHVGRTVYSNLAFRSDGAKIFALSPSDDKIHTYSAGPGLRKSSGSWSTSDLHKRILANSGVANILTPSGYYYATTPLASYSDVSAGNWSVTAGNVNATKGITTNSYVYRRPPFTNTLGHEKSYVGSYSTTASVKKHNVVDSGRLITIDNDINGILYYSYLSTSYDLSGITSLSEFDLTEGGTYTIVQESHTWKPDGTRLYVYDLTSNAGTIHEYTLTTAFDLTTATYTAGHTGIETLFGDTGLNGLRFSSNGLYLFMQDETGEQYYRGVMSTAWDLSTLTFAGTSSSSDYWVDTGGQVDHYGFDFSPDGYKFYYHSNDSQVVVERTLTTPWDFSSLTLITNGQPQESRWFRVDTNIGTSFSITFDDDGEPLYFYWHDNGVDKIVRYSFIDDKRTEEWAIAVTNAAGQIDTSTWIDLNTFTPDESVPSGSAVYYAMSRDNKQSFEIVTESGGVRTIALLDTVWKYNQANVYSANTFAVASSNNMFVALKEAVEWEGLTNRWSNTQISIVTDENNFPSANSSFFANTFDLAIMLKPGAQESSIPTSDAISINYDSAIRERGAILGTHYTWVKESNTEIEITVLEDAGSNYKFRVI